MTPEEAVARARQSIGYRCFYRLGKGGMRPGNAFPWNKEVECDCSGFAMWCLGISRHYQGTVWFDTSAIEGDAKSHDGMIFVEIPWKESRPGDLVVYGDYTKNEVRRQGHVGVVVMVDSEGPHKVVHCGQGNWTRSGDAIQETLPGPWNLHPSIVARCKLLDCV